MNVFKEFYLTHRWDSNRYYKVDLEVMTIKSIPYSRDLQGIQSENSRPHWPGENKYIRL